MTGLRGGAAGTARRAWAALASLAAALLVAAALPARAQAADGAAAAFPAWRVVGDAVPEPLTATRGNATRGRAIVGNRQLGLCLLCHAGPFPEPHLHGTLAPPLAGAGARLGEGQLRARLLEPQRFNPDTLMPAYGPVAGLRQVGAAWRGRPILDAQQIEDVVAYLRTLDQKAP